MAMANRCPRRDFQDVTMKPVRAVGARLGSACAGGRYSPVGLLRGLHPFALGEGGCDAMAG